MNIINKIYKLSDNNEIDKALNIISEYIMECSLSFNEEKIDDFLLDIDVNKLRIELTFNLIEFLDYYKDGLNNYSIFVDKAYYYTTNLNLYTYINKIERIKNAVH